MVVTSRYPHRPKAPWLLTAVKAATARDQWCTAVNNHGAFGRWGYLEVTTMLGAGEVLGEAIENLLAEAPIVGDPDRSLPLR